VTIPYEAAVAQLRRSFLRQRPLRAGSLIITLFGDSIAPRGGEISLASLIAVLASFGLTERLVRTAVGRLAQEGWLAAKREGRLSFYGLTRVGSERFAEATRRIYAAPPARWRGRWTLVLANARGSKALRDDLEWLGFGQLATGTLAHPDTDMQRVRREMRDPALLDDALILTANASAAGADQQLIERGWNLADLERRYRRFVALFGPLLEAVAARASPAPEASLVARTLLIHEYRRVHLRDPLLPRNLLPADWAGSAAYELCRKLYGLVYRAADRHLDAVASTRRGRLPAAGADLHRRFGHR